MINKLQDTFQTYTKKHNTIQKHLRKTFFSEKNQLPQVGLEPTTLCSLDECSTNSGVFELCCVSLCMFGRCLEVCLLCIYLVWSLFEMLCLALP